MDWSNRLSISNRTQVIKNKHITRTTIKDALGVSHIIDWDA